MKTNLDLHKVWSIYWQPAQLAYRGLLAVQWYRIMEVLTLVAAAEIVAWLR